MSYIQNYRRRYNKFKKTTRATNLPLANPDCCLVQDDLIAGPFMRHFDGTSNTRDKTWKELMRWTKITLGYQFGDGWSIIRGLVQVVIVFDKPEDVLVFKMRWC